MDFYWNQQITGDLSSLHDLRLDVRREALGFRGFFRMCWYVDLAYYMYILYVYSIYRFYIYIWIYTTYKHVDM